MGYEDRLIPSLLAFEQVLKGLVEQSRRLKPKPKPPIPDGRDDRDEGDERSPKAPRPPMDIFTLTALFRGRTPIDVGLGSGRDPNAKHDPNLCPKPKGNNKFDWSKYFTCRCKNGDSSACAAASKLQEDERQQLIAIQKQKANSGGGSGGGF